MIQKPQPPPPSYEVAVGDDITSQRIQSPPREQRRTRENIQNYDYDDVGYRLTSAGTFFMGLVLTLIGLISIKSLVAGIFLLVISILFCSYVQIRRLCIRRNYNIESNV